MAGRALTTTKFFPFSRLTGSSVFDIVYHDILLTACFMTTASTPVALQVESSSNLLDSTMLVTRTPAAPINTTKTTIV
jgi:hypothetical protein